MLEIGIDEHRCSALPSNVIKASQHRRLFPEIPGELNQSHGCRCAELGLTSLPKPNLRHGAVAGAIVDQHQSLHAWYGEHALNKRRNHGLFVETSGYNPNTFRFHHRSCVEGYEEH